MDVRTEKIGSEEIGSEEIGEKQERDWNGMRYWLLFKSIDLKRTIGILFLGLCILLTACKREEKTVRDEAEGNIAEEVNTQSKVESDAEKDVHFQNKMEGTADKEGFVQDEMENNADKYIDSYPYIDYDFIEKYHMILNHNICTSPKNDYYNTVLEEYLRENVESDKKIIDQQGEGCPLTIDYFRFDFNADGLEDYLVCLHGSLWNENGGNCVRIYIQENDGSLRRVLSSNAHFHDTGLPNEHAPVAVLDERTEGYYAVVLPGRNRILRYNKEEDEYEFYEIESNTAVESHATSGAESDAEEAEYMKKQMYYSEIKHAEMKASIDYEFIEKKHKILKHNICTSPKNDHNNTILEKYLKKDAEEDEKMIRELGSGSPLTIDYFPFDFNADGLEDYLVCYHGSLWCGSGGNTVMIYTQEGNGSLRKILDITVRLHEPDLPDGHAPIAVLDEKTDGYYGIVLPGSNRILRYDKERDWYEFEIEMGNCQYTCEKVTDGYEVTLYDKKYKKVYTEIYPKEPWIKEITEDILEIGISTGSPCSYVFYFQKSDAKMSETYYSPILIKNKYVAYMEERRELTLTDIFNEGLLHEKIVRDFTETADPVSAVISIEMPDDENILLEYYKGADYEKEEEIIAINKAIAKD